MLLFYIRHGDPIYNPDSLTELGHKQAAALAKRLSLYGLDRIYSSPSVRAQQTAQPTCELLNKPMTVCEWAHEAHAAEGFWISEGTKEDCWCFQHNRVYPQLLLPEVLALGFEWYAHPLFEKYNFAKGIKHADESVDAFLEQLGYRHDREHSRYEIIKPNDERVALFAHQGFGMCFLSSLLDIPYPLFCTHFDFGHSAMTVIEFQQRGDYAYARVLQHSNDSHLYREELLTGYQNAVLF